MISRSIYAALWLAAAAYAGPPLTTIQDVLYKADGTRFNGALTISWSSFQSADNSAIVTQSTTVKVLDGNLRVQLVPNTTASPTSAYLVTYNSDGRIQFQERWLVPSSPQPLRVRDVRTAASPSSTASNDTASAGPVTETDVVGLVADLGARPVKGSGFAAGRVAIVNNTGLLESVSGSPTDCVRVDGSSGPCGAAAPSFIDGDSPAGIVDGANPAFTISTTPDPVASVAVYRNGLLQKLGSDYSFTGRTIQFVTAAVPQPGDTLLASYRLSASDTGSPALYPAPQILCSGAGGATNATALTSLGTCAIPASILSPGDRVEIRFDFEHLGTAGGFSFETRWGATPIGHRDAASSDVLASGRTDAAIVSSGARLSSESWGTALPFAAAVASSGDSWSAGLIINFQGKVSSASDTLTLRNYAVVRLP